MADRGDRGDVDDRTAALPRHHRYHMLHGEEGALEIDRENAIPLGFRNFNDASHLGNADVVIEHVDTAVRPEACLNHRFDLRATRNIGGERGCVSSFGGDDFHGLFGGSGIAVNAKHLSALARKRHGGCLAIAPARPNRAGADHHRYLPLEPVHPLLLSASLKQPSPDEAPREIRPTCPISRPIALGFIWGKGRRRSLSSRWGRLDDRRSPTAPGTVHRCTAAIRRRRRNCRAALAASARA